MPRTSFFVRAGILVGAVGAVFGCTEAAKVLAPRFVNPIFTSYVALGNSITAGYQSGGINDSTQQQSYAVQLASVMQTRFAYPSLTKPGCPPPTGVFFTGALVGTGSTANTCLLRNPSLFTDVLNNVAVPGATAEDPDSTVGPAGNTLTALFLGGKTQVGRALVAHPTFATIWIGNNDVLAAAISGFITPTPPFSNGVTPEATFEASYNKMMADLLAGAPNLKGILIGVANVLDIPQFFPVSALASANFVATLNNYTGKTITVDPTTCPPLNTANNANLIAFSAIQAIKAGTLAGSAYPALIECAHNPATAPVGDVFVLTAASQAAVLADITAYNAFIKGVAAAKGFAYVDPNKALDSLKNQAFRVPSAFTGGTAAGGSVTTGSTTLWADATSYNRSAGSFLTNGFFPGQLVSVTGFTSAANNGTALVTAVTALKLTVSKFPQTTLSTPTDSGTGRTVSSAPGFGPYFSFDGIHPTVNTHTLIANYLIDAINAMYGTSIPKLPNPTI